MEGLQFIQASIVTEKKAGKSVNGHFETLAESLSHSTMTVYCQFNIANW